MLDFDDLVQPGEDDLMLADDGAAAEGRYPDFMFSSGLADALALIDIFGVVREGVTSGAGQHQRSSAGGVNLAPVVALDDLNVEAVARNSQARL